MDWILMDGSHFVQDQAPQAASEGAMDLRRLGSDLWRHRWLLLILLALMITCAALYLRLATYRYVAVLQLTPTDQQTSVVPGGLASIGSVVGLDVSDTAGSSYALFGEALKTRPVANALATDPRIMRTIFSAHWNPQTGAWSEPPSPLRPFTRTAKSILGVPSQPWKAPDAENLREAMFTKIVIEEDRKKKITTLSFEHSDKLFAAYFLSRAAAEADNYLRKRSLKRSTDYIEYLEGRLAVTEVAEQRLAIARSLMQHENTRMMASVESPYAGESFGLVNVSEQPVSPQPIRILGLAVVLSFAIWFGYVALLLPILKRSASEPDETVTSG